VYANGRFVIVGSNGIVLASANGVAWSRSVMPDSSRYLYSITHANDLYVAVGSYVLCTSPDAVTWSITRDTSLVLYSVAYGNGRFVAVGGRGRFLYSSDGTDWSMVETGQSSDELIGVCFGGEQFVAVSRNNSNSGERVFTSPDGSSWTPQPVDTHFVPSSIVYGNDRYITVGLSGVIMSSADAGSWENMRKGPVGTVYAMTYGKGLFVGVNLPGQILTSPDAQEWTSVDPGTSRQLSGIAFCMNRFVAVGPKGTIVLSDDAKTWTAVNGLDTTKHPNAVTSNDSMYVAVGSKGMVWTSLDGSNWEVDSVGISQTLCSVVWGNNMFVAVGGNTRNDSGKIATSPDGRNWNVITADPDKPLTDVTFGNGQFVAVGYWGDIFNSIDGVTWTTLRSTVSYLQGVTWGEHQFVAVGYWGKVLSSVDGISWSTMESGAYPHMYCVAYGNGRFVAGGANGMILSSPEDEADVDRKTHFHENRHKSVAFSLRNGYFVAPLPFTGATGPVEVRLFGISGRMNRVLTLKPCDGMIRIPSDNVPPGVYAVSVTGKNGRMVSLLHARIQ
jgi:hypothetical protein